MRKHRDMTAREFSRALARRGFRKILLWIEIGPDGPSVGMVVNPNGKINRRASLAHAIRRYEQETAAFVCPLCGQHIKDGKPCGCGART